MIPALAATGAMSVGAVAVTVGAHPLVAAGAFAAALAVLLLAQLGWIPDAAGPFPDRSTRALLALGALAVVIDRSLFVRSSGIAADELLAAAAIVTVALPRGRTWTALAAACAIAAFAVAGATLVASTRYHSDAVVAAHGGAALVLAGRQPYAELDLVDQLARFGLPPEYATPLEDGTRLRSLQYPALAVLVPVPFLALGLSDVRVLYLVEVLAIFALATLSAAPRWRAVALAGSLGNVIVLDQFVDAGIDPLWALLILAAWLARRHRAMAVLLGLALATRQPAWLIAPLVLAWSWRALGAREALARGAIALGVALAVHLPFLATAPGAVLAGVTDPALLPLEPRGIGPAKLAADGIGPLLPRSAYLAAVAAAYLAALWAVASGRVRRARGAPLVLALLPLWLSWRALQSYFAFLPLFALSGEDTPFSVTTIPIGPRSSSDMT